MQLTKSEMEIMDVLWDAGKPLSRADLLDRSEEKTWKDSSVHILLNGLLQKGDAFFEGPALCTALGNLTVQFEQLPVLRFYFIFQSALGLFVAFQCRPAGQKNCERSDHGSGQ